MIKMALTGETKSPLTLVMGPEMEDPVERLLGELLVPE